MILVDSNVFIDIFTQDTEWYSWSLNALSDAASKERITINPIIYSEISIGFHSTSELDNALSNIGVLNEQISKDVAFAAGKAFVKYRRNGGKKSSPLPDFFIGAHANCSSYKLLSRDQHRFLNYFPNLELINPFN